MKKPKILVHICCAICGVALIEKLKENFDPVLYYYNPNIYPEDEYLKRKESVIKMAEIYGLEFISAQGGPASGWEEEYKSWQEKIKACLPAGRAKKEPERGSRCFDCFEMRLEKTVNLAKEKGIEIFTTTLFVSPFKDESQVDLAGNKMAEKFGIKYLQMKDIIGNKKENWKQTRELAKKHGFYFQKYCGCIFTKKI